MQQLATQLAHYAPELSHTFSFAVLPLSYEVCDGRLADGVFISLQLNKCSEAMNDDLFWPCLPLMILRTPRKHKLY